MSFPVDDKYWLDTANFLKSYVEDLEPIIAPLNFIDIFPGTYPPRCLYAVKNAIDFCWAVLHKGEMEEIEYSFLEQITREFTPVFANAVFVVFSKRNELVRVPNDFKHLKAFRNKMKLLAKKNTRRANERHKPNQKIARCGIVVNTYNRPHALRYSLPQIVSLGAPVIVVDDGSDKDCYEQNLQIAQKHGVPLLRLPHNRGLSCGINIGLSYWLADPKIEWISCFNDDVDVCPDLLKKISTIQDPVSYPVCTGYDAAEHSSLRETNINGYSVLLKRSTPGVHLHGHRSYWEAVMPIPAPYLGAPKKDSPIKGRGAEGDWWTVSWAPNSIAKQGLFVACIPGLVHTFFSKPEESTWGNILSKEG